MNKQYDSVALRQTDLVKVSAILLGLFLMGMLTGCGGAGNGSGGGSSPTNAPTCATLQGHYYAQADNTITMDVSGGCTFTDSVCAYGAVYTIPDASTGATTILINSTNGAPGCMSNTTHSCIIGYNGVQLAINCDSGAHQFLMIKQ